MLNRRYLIIFASGFFITALSRAEDCTFKVFNSLILTPTSVRIGSVEEFFVQGAPVPPDSLPEFSEFGNCDYPKAYPASETAFLAKSGTRLALVSVYPEQFSRKTHGSCSLIHESVQTGTTQFMEKMSFSYEHGTYFAHWVQPDLEFHYQFALRQIPYRGLVVQVIEDWVSQKPYPETHRFQFYCGFPIRSSR